MKHLTAVLAILMMIFVGLACSGDETDKANALVDEANKFVTDGNKSVTDAESKGKEFDTRVDGIKSEDDQKEVVEFGEKELIPLFEKMRDNFQKAGDKFSEAGRLKVNEKYKEYLDTKGSEFKKRAEHAESMKAVPKSLSSSKNEKEYREAAKKDNEKSQKLLAEAKELADKAEKIRSENPSIFKKN